MPRVIAYIDGFNLYFGLKSQGWERFLWLDVQALSRNLLKPDQTLARAKYFTSRVAQPPDKAKRQSTYIDAINTLADTSIYSASTRPTRTRAATAATSTTRTARR